MAATQFVHNTNTGVLVPVTSTLKAQPYLVPYVPTKAELRIGRKIGNATPSATTVEGTGKPSPGPDLAAADVAPAAITTEFVEAEPEVEGPPPIGEAVPPVEADPAAITTEFVEAERGRTGSDPDAAAADSAPAPKPRKPRGRPRKG